MTPHERAKLSARRREILRQRRVLADGREEKVSERTLQRWLASYRQDGLAGLYPKERCDKGKPRALPPETLAEAVALKAELRCRSVWQVIEILETTEKASPGEVKASTSVRLYAQAGLPKLPKHETRGFRRFRREYPNSLWRLAGCPVAPLQELSV